MQGDQGLRAVIVGALDLGGTHVSGCRVSIESPSANADAFYRVDFAPDASKDELLAAIAKAARAVDGAEVDRWAVATPGPFDYERGVCTIRGVGKRDSLYASISAPRSAPSCGRRRQRSPS